MLIPQSVRCCAWFRRARRCRRCARVDRAGRRFAGSTNTARTVDTTAQPPGGRRTSRLCDYRRERRSAERTRAQPSQAQGPKRRTRSHHPPAVCDASPMPRALALFYRAPHAPRGRPRRENSAPAPSVLRAITTPSTTTTPLSAAESVPIAAPEVCSDRSRSSSLRLATANPLVPSVRRTLGERRVALYRLLRGSQPRSLFVRQHIPPDAPTPTAPPANPDPADATPDPASRRRTHRPAWVERHGAALGLRAILQVHGATAGLRAGGTATSAPTQRATAYVHAHPA